MQTFHYNHNSSHLLKALPYTEVIPIHPNSTMWINVDKAGEKKILMVTHFSVLGLNDMEMGGKGEAPSPMLLFRGLLGCSSFYHKQLAPCTPSVWRRWYVCLLLCQYGTINFVPSRFQDRFIVWINKKKYTQTHRERERHIQIYSVTYLEIVVRTLSAWTQVSQQYLSNCFWFSGHLEIVKSSLGCN